MLIIKCAGCKRKLFRYDKIGKGAVLRCYFKRISKYYDLQISDETVSCPCGKIIGHKKENAIKMIQSAFTWTGTKRSKNN